MLICSAINSNEIFQDFPVCKSFTDKGGIALARRELNL